MPDNGGLALTFAYHYAKFRRQAGIIKSIEILYCSTYSSKREVRTLYQINVYSNTTYSKDNTSALVLRLAISINSITTVSNITIHNSGTMTGASR